MKAKKFFESKWQYIIVFLIPWILMLIHSVLRGAWPISDGSILYKNAGNLYVQLYTELWDKVREGGSFAFDWSSGLGMEFAISFLRYLVSPFTLIMLLVPRAAIADAVQILMVLKWSLLSVAMLYYVSNTRHNRIERRRQLMCIVFAMMYSLSNTIVFAMQDLSSMDVMILFPFLLLLTEKMAEKKGFRRFYVLFALTILMNYQLAIPVAIFLVVWFVIQFDEDVSFDVHNAVSFIVSYVAAIITGMVVVLPNMASEMDSIASGSSAVASVIEFVQRFFVCDTLLIAQENQPMLYCSLVAVLLALIYVFIKISVKKKIGVLVLTLLLCVGQISESVNHLWNGTLQYSSAYAFLLVFLIMYMAMETCANMDSVKMWQIILVGAVCIAACVGGFFGAAILLEFYVYLATILVVVFAFMMLVFYRKKSIQYQNVLVVLAIICVAELSANAVYQLSSYDEYALEKMYNHQAAENLTTNLAVENGERIAMVQGMYNYGMKMQVPSASWSHAVGSSFMSDFYQSLGMEWSTDGAAYFGGSPLLNAMFNIRYGLGQNEMPFSDCEQIKSTKDMYHLYEMQRLVGLGYMVNSDVESWNLEMDSPFFIQNDFVEKSTGNGKIFEPLSPEIRCLSMKGVDPHAEHNHSEDEEMGEHDHSEEVEQEHEHTHDTDAELYLGEYINDDTFYYHFQKIYEEDLVNMSFESDGVTDYYIHMKGANPSITYVQIKGEYVCWDQFASNQKTIHIGVVPKGYMISLISNFDIDGMDYSEVWYQVAGFHEEEYAKVYDALSDETLQITNYGDDCIEGTITAQTKGVMMTSVPAYEGMSVMVDGNEVACQRIGGVFIGVPLESGTHQILIRYQVPYLMQGMIISLVGVCIYVVYCVGVLFVGKKKKIEG